MASQFTGKTINQLIALINTYVVDDNGAKKVDEAGLRDYILINLKELPYYDQNSALASSPEVDRLVNGLVKAVNKESFSQWTDYPTGSLGSSAIAETSKVLADIQTEAKKVNTEIRTYYETITKDYDNKLKEAFLLALTVPGGNTPAAGVELRDVYRTYIYTYVTDRGEESAPSPAVATPLKIDQNDNVLVEWAAPPGNRPDINRVRIYRNSAGNTSSGFMLIHPLVDITVTNKYDGAKANPNYLDNFADDRLGEPCPTFNWEMPPATMQGLVALPNGIMAGFVGNSIYFSEPNLPYAWNLEYTVVIEYEVVGMVAFGQSIFVGTKGNPYVVSGADSAGMSAIKLELNQSCVSKRSLKTIGSSVIYASPDGLVLYQNGGANVYTSGIIGKADWQALTPSSIRGVEFENRYYAFHTGGCLIFDLTSGSYTKSDQTADAVFSDRTSDTLFILTGTTIKNASTLSGTALTGSYKSRVYRFPKSIGLAWLYIDADTALSASTTTVKLYRDGVLVMTKSVTTNEPVRLPAGIGLEWQVWIESNIKINWAALTSTTEELKQVP
jgi:hypothetical protein